MNREEAFQLILLLQKTRTSMDVGDALAFVRAAVMDSKQQPFVYDVLASLEEAEEAGDDYEKQKALISSALAFVNRALQQGKQD